MLAAMISDAHLTGRDDPNQARLAALLDSLETPRLFLLGDIFQFWWSFRGHAEAEYAPVLEALDRVQQRGTRVTYVPGNHDFALRHFEERGVVVSSHVRCLLGGRRFRLLHGDEADASAGYALTRAVLRGSVFAGVMRLAGPTRGRQLGMALAGGSRQHVAPSAPLVAAQEALASQLLESSDVVVMGHSHAPGVHHLTGGTYVNLGDFVEHHTWLAVTEDGLELRSA
ncbi:MAG: UDP-2,3-diacylglucosamine diphosphatase [Proteobacteria bacterium]|nr:UDP-2,3-diacylglucosamine diphosphatase [Pseudomonadota bacterium]MCP4915797.1 UDP-2,3-diacylglucosamine diphosphatase [Pseudomonadota bacterium]